MGTRIDHAGLFALLASLADNKQALGRHYAYWCSSVSALEAAVAAAAMAQDELGHARMLYPLLEQFSQSEADPRQTSAMTRTLRYHLAALDTNPVSWPDFVAFSFFVDTALTTFFAAARASRYEPLCQCADKIVQEERIHRVYATGWIHLLARSGGGVRLALIDALLRLWDETLCWFGPDDDVNMLRLYHEGIIDATPTQLRERFLHTTIPALHEQDIVVPATLDSSSGTWQFTRQLPWSTWDEECRRLRVLRIH